MDEWIQVDEVIHDNLLYLLPIDNCPELVQVDHVLHQEGCI